MNMNYFITPSASALEEALTSWTWLGLEGKKPILVTAFGDVFFQSNDGFWFLDTVEGEFKFLCQSRDELDAGLSTHEGSETYLFSSFVDHAATRGQRLGSGQCYDFKVPPILGGARDHANVEKLDFMVALDLRGQIHEQLCNVPVGTQITELKLVPKQRSKPWWKLW